jgi:hypothetical protein
MTMMNPQLDADLPIRRDLSPSQAQPQAEQEISPTQPVYAQDDEPVTVAQGETDTFEVSMDDWFKA